MLIKCKYCGNDCEKTVSAVNRANKINAPLYCNQICSGLARRTDKSIEIKKAEKAEYDKIYREKNKEYRKKLKAEYYQKTRDPIKEAAYRKKNMARHVEYCRQPEYKEKKKIYDQEYRSKKNYGEFWESAIILIEIEQNIDRRLANESNETFNKSQKRKKEWKQMLNNQNLLPRI